MVWYGMVGPGWPCTPARSCHNLFPLPPDWNLSSSATNKTDKAGPHGTGSSVGLRVKGVKGSNMWLKTKTLISWWTSTLIYKFNSTVQCTYLLWILKELIFTWRVRERPSFPWTCFTSVDLETFTLDCNIDRLEVIFEIISSQAGRQYLAWKQRKLACERFLQIPWIDFPGFTGWRHGGAGSSQGVSIGKGTR